MSYSLFDLYKSPPPKKEGSVLSFLKAEWKVSDTGLAHWASSWLTKHFEINGQISYLHTSRKKIVDLKNRFLRFFWRGDLYKSNRLYDIVCFQCSKWASVRESLTISFHIITQSWDIKMKVNYDIVFALCINSFSYLRIKIDAFLSHF
jgi:hypothetical protein